MNWRKGGWSGSIRAHAHRVAHAQLEESRGLHRVRYGFGQRLARHLFSIRTFGGFIGLYVLINLIFGMLEIASAHLAPSLLPAVTTGNPDLAIEVEALMLNVSSYLLGAQIGLLGVISLSLTLVTLIAQKEGSSTDIQLYYHESMALELVASCVALAVVLCVQFVWPLQLLLHHIGLGAGVQLFKLVLFSLHLFWLLVNLCVAAYFILTTFRFVQQSARERFRDRYTAYVILPRDLERYLRTQLYAHGGQNMPGLSFGEVPRQAGTNELESHFSHPMMIHDVRMRWVHWVARRWWTRSLKAMPELDQQPESARPRLFFIPTPDEQLSGPVALCKRVGGTPLTYFERLILKCSFRFRRASLHTPKPTPADILEGLADNTLAQIDRQAPVAFDSAFSEMTRYHQFMLWLSVAHGVDGQRFSFIQQADYAWHPPHRNWTSQYRRLFRRATEHLYEEEHFLRTVARTPHHLLPRHGEAPLPASLEADILKLGPLLLQQVESWSSRHRTEPHELDSGSAHILAEVMPELAQTWCDLLHAPPVLYDWPTAIHTGDAAAWNSFHAAWPFLWGHLANSAYSLAQAAVNADDAGAGAFADALLRWSDLALRHLPTVGGEKARYNLRPDLLEHPWAGAISLLSPNEPAPKASALFADIVRSVHADIILLTSTQLLRFDIERQEIGLPTRIALALAGPGSSLPEHQMHPAPIPGTNLLPAILRQMDTEEAPHRSSYMQDTAHLSQALHALSHLNAKPEALHAEKELDKQEELCFALALLLTEGESATSGAATTLGNRPLHFRAVGGPAFRKARQHLNEWLQAPPPQLANALHHLRPNSRPEEKISAFRALLHALG
ncbi:hypothetical protein ACT6QH_09885 [Xanthobacter sp. TB0139]|uniref:hypothetical protein n=1 Tax=Xanthobacter sp. TB0139 TaxID=3459178 RepID=UPI00403A0767